MNEFDPHIDLIDRYLRGELQGAELEAFMTKLQTDLEFKTAFEQQQKLAAAVYAFGHAEMKQYLRQKTQHRGVFNLSKKTWYFAAASVMLIAFSSAIIIWKLNQNAENTGIITKTQQDTSVSGKRQDPIVKQESVKQNNTADTTELDNVVINENELPPTIENTDTEYEAVVAEPEPIIIASNVQAVAITLASQTEARKSLKAEASEMKRTRAAEDDVQPESATAGQTAKAKQSGRTDNAGSDYLQTEQTAYKKTAMRFSLSFFETPRKTPKVEIQKYNDMYFVRCYDIVYGNPLVYEWQNRYFLHSGLKIYELLNMPVQNGQNTAIAAAQEVTDPGILKLIGR